MMKKRVRKVLCAARGVFGEMGVGRWAEVEPERVQGERRGVTQVAPAVS